MGTKSFIGLAILALAVSLSTAQVPKRILIPGAVPLGGPVERPLQFRRPQLQQQQPQNAPLRLRRPIPNAIPVPLPAIRPVVEEQEDSHAPASSLNLNEEVARLSQIPIQSAAPRQQLYEEEEEDEPPQQQQQQQQRQYQPQPVQFRPERPPIQVSQPVRSQPAPVRQAQPAVRAQARQVNRPAPRPQYAADEEEPQRRGSKKPVVQILRKYRDDNPDGSITWGFENSDGTFKEENIGIDCITRGKYGYIDPDGNRREYTYETGLKCDQPDPEELPEELYNVPQGAGKLLKRPQPVRLQ